MATIDIAIKSERSSANESPCVFNGRTFICEEHGGLLSNNNPSCPRRKRGDKLDARIASREAAGKSTERLRLKRNAMRTMRESPCVFDRRTFICAEHGGLFTNDNPSCPRRKHGDKLDARIASLEAAGKSSGRLRVKRNAMRPAQ